MRVLLQRVSSASVKVDGEVISEISQGIMALVGFGAKDNESVLTPMTEKLLDLRVFPDEKGKFHFSLRDIKGGLLLVPQFTLYGSTAKGRRPDFGNSLHPDRANPLFDEFVKRAQSNYDATLVQTGRFGADMKVSLVNDGPVTLQLEMDPKS